MLNLILSLCLILTGRKTQNITETPEGFVVLGDDDLFQVSPHRTWRFIDILSEEYSYLDDPKHDDYLDGRLAYPPVAGKVDVREGASIGWMWNDNWD